MRFIKAIIFLLETDLKCWHFRFIWSQAPFIITRYNFQWINCNRWNVILSIAKNSLPTMIMSLRMLRWIEIRYDIKDKCKDFVMRMNVFDVAVSFFFLLVFPFCVTNWPSQRPWMKKLMFHLASAIISRRQCIRICFVTFIIHTNLNDEGYRIRVKRQHQLSIASWQSSRIKIRTKTHYYGM